MFYKLRRLFAPFAVFALFVAPTALYADQYDRDVADNRAFDQKITDAYRRLDVNAMMSLYANSPELIVVFADGTQVKGWNDVKTAYSAFFTQFNHIRGDYTEQNYVEAGTGLIAFGKGYFYLTQQGSTTEQRLDFRYTDYREKRNGAWVSVIDTIQAVAYQPLPTDSLYLRMGGYDVLAQITDDFVKRMTSDPQIGHYFAGMSSDSRQKMRQLMLDQIASLSGGPVTYSGRDPRTAHSGLGISSDDWKQMMTLFDQTMDTFKVPFKERGDLRATVAGLQAQIVEK